MWTHQKVPSDPAVPRVTKYETKARAYRRMPMSRTKKTDLPEQKTQPKTSKTRGHPSCCTFPVPSPRATLQRQPALAFRSRMINTTSTRINTVRTPISIMLARNLSGAKWLSCAVSRVRIRMRRTLAMSPTTRKGSQARECDLREFLTVYKISPATRASNRRSSPCVAAVTSPLHKLGAAVDHHVAHHHHPADQQNRANRALQKCLPHAQPPLKPVEPLLALLRVHGTLLPNTTPSKRSPTSPPLLRRPSWPTCGVHGRTSRTPG